MVFVVLCPGAHKGSTGSCSDFNMYKDVEIGFSDA